MQPTPTSAVDLLQRMVSFDTVNHGEMDTPFVERELALELEAISRAWGFATARLPVASVGFNLLVTHEVSASGPWLMFDSHLDTVAVDGMTVDPFSGMIRNGRLYGRGSCDTKGTGAAMLWALKERADLGVTPELNIAILFTINEETYRVGAEAFVNDHLPALPWRPSGVIVGEPTNLQMVTAHTGHCRWDVSTRGIATHSSEPSLGRSAISDMVRVIQAIERDYIPFLDASHPMTGKAQCSINLIRGGSGINVIPAGCCVSIDRRLVPGESGDTVVEDVKAILNGLVSQSPDMVIDHSPPHITPPLSPQNNQRLRSIVATILQGLGLSTKARGAKYGTHASTYASAGLASVVLGPGDIAQAHSKDEFIELAEFEKGIELYRQLMLLPKSAFAT